MSNQSYLAHPTAIIDEGCEIGEGVKIWHFSHIMPGCKIGDGCNIGQNVVVSLKEVLGKNVRVQNNVSFYEAVICKDDVFLGRSTVFANVIHPRSDVAFYFLMQNYNGLINIREGEDITIAELPELIKNCWI